MSGGGGGSRTDAVALPSTTYGLLLPLESLNPPKCPGRHTYYTRGPAGRATSVARRGFYVLAGVHRGTDADALRATNLEPIMLDITNDAEIAMLVKRIADDPDRRPLRALVNNAATWEAHCLADVERAISDQK
jgi:hypothetical protein